MKTASPGTLPKEYTTSNSVELPKKWCVLSFSICLYMNSMYLFRTIPLQVKIMITDKKKIHLSLLDDTKLEKNVQDQRNTSTRQKTSSDLKILYSWCLSVDER